MGRKIPFICLVRGMKSPGPESKTAKQRADTMNKIAKTTAAAILAYGTLASPLAMAQSTTGMQMPGASTQGQQQMMGGGDDMMGGRNVSPQQDAMANGMGSPARINNGMGQNGAGMTGGQNNGMGAQNGMNQMMMQMMMQHMQMMMKNMQSMGTTGINQNGMGAMGGMGGMGGNQFSPGPNQNPMGAMGNSQGTVNGMGAMGNADMMKNIVMNMSAEQREMLLEMLKELQAANN